MFKEMHKISDPLLDGTAENPAIMPPVPSKEIQPVVPDGSSLSVTEQGDDLIRYRKLLEEMGRIGIDEKLVAMVIREGMEADVDFGKPDWTSRYKFTMLAMDLMKMAPKETVSDKQRASVNVMLFNRIEKQG
jgi:hypothetical protein